MNRELEVLILAYEAAAEARDKEAEKRLQVFETLLDEVLDKRPGLSRDTLRKSVIKAHRKWALKQAKKPTYIPPRT